MEPGESERLARLGLSITVRSQGSGFSLPCPCYREGHCAEYNERPKACSGYQCKLLRRHLAGEVTWEEGLRRVEQVKRLAASIRGRLGTGDGLSIWQQLRSARGQGSDLDPELQMDMASLLSLSRRYFRTEAEGEGA